MIKLITILCLFTFCFLKAEDQDLAEKMKLLGSNDAKVRIKAKEEILRECYKYTYLLKQNLNNSDLEIQESSKEILSKFYNYQLEGMQGKLLPLVSKEKSTAEFNKFYKAWLFKKFNSSYQKFGNKSPKWDNLIENLFDNVLDIYIRKKNNTKEVIAVAKSILDLGCQDPLVTYIYANLNSFLGSSRVALEYFQLSEKRYEIYKYDSVFRFFVFNKLLINSLNEGDKIAYAKKALQEMKIYFDQAKNESDNKLLCKLAFEFRESLYNSDVFYKFFDEENQPNASEMYRFFYNYYISSCTNKKDEALSSMLEVSVGLLAKYPNIVEIPAAICDAYFENEDQEEGRNWFYKAIEIRPDFTKIFEIMQNSLTRKEVEGNEILLFGAECLGSNISNDISNLFVVAIWQNICNKSYYNGCRWDQAFKDPYSYEIIKYGLEKTLINNPVQSDYLKSLKGLYAWLGDDIKTAIVEIANYKNTPFLHQFQCYVSKEDVLADIYPLLMIKDENLISFRSQFQKDGYSTKRMNLFLNAWQQHPSEKDRFYLSRLFPYLNFTDDSAINAQIFSLMLDYGRNELIIKKYQNYKKAKINLPPQVEELIKTNFSETFNIFFEITNKSKINSVDDLNALRQKMKQMEGDLSVKNKANGILNKTEATRSYLREVYEYSLNHFNNKLSGENIFNSLDGVSFIEFYETRRPQLYLNEKDIRSFNNCSHHLYFPFLSRNGVNDQKEWQSLSVKVFKNEAEVFTTVKKIYGGGYSLPFKFKLGLLLKKQGFIEIAEYILIETYSYYLQTFCFQREINLNAISVLIPIKGLENYACDLIELVFNLPKSYSMNDELILFFCLVNNKRYDYALFRSSTFDLDRKFRNYSSSYEYDSIQYKTIDFINLLRKKLNEEKEINDSVRTKLLKTLDKFEEVQVNLKK